MTLVQSATWRGWLALIFLGMAAVCFEYASFGPAYYHLAPWFWVFLVPGLWYLRGWWKLKRRIRELDYQAAAFKKG